MIIATHYAVQDKGHIVEIFEQYKNGTGYTNRAHTPTPAKLEVFIQFYVSNSMSLHHTKTQIRCVTSLKRRFGNVGSHTRFRGLTSISHGGFRRSSLSDLPNRLPQDIQANSRISLISQKYCVLERRTSKYVARG